MVRWWRGARTDDGFERLLASLNGAVDDPARMAAIATAALAHPGLRRASAQLLPALQLVRGRGLRTSPAGDRRANLEAARDALSESCAGYERLGVDDALAQALHELGLVYAHRLVGDAERNLEESIVCHRRALELRPDAEGRAMAAYELGRRYAVRRGGDPQRNRETALDLFRRAAEDYRGSGRIDRWADAMVQAGESHERGGDRDAAIACYTEAVEACDEDSGWQGWADAMRLLGRALTDGGDDERALTVLRRALAVLERTGGAPQARSAVEHTLGVVYSGRQLGDRAENIELAIGHFEAALRLIDPAEAPGDFATTQHQLAAAYDYRLAGDRRANLDRALTHLGTALRHVDRHADPDHWAAIQQSTGTIYLKRSLLPGRDAAGDRSRAREALRQVLTVRTPQHDPAGSARAREELAMLDSEEHLPEAAESLREAVETRVPEQDPVGWASGRILLEEVLRRQAEQGGTPRIWRGKDLQDLANDLDTALEAIDANG